MQLRRRDRRGGPDDAGETDAGDNDDANDDPGEFNACGGEQELSFDGDEAAPGDGCGECGDGVLTCDGPDELRCIDATEPNACGGCEPLADEPGEECGDCGGQWTCDGQELICDDPTNACGGCTGLAGQPGDECGPDSEWQCDGEEDVECVFLGDYNQCGGTEDLDETPGTECGDCGTWICEDENTVSCEGDTDIQTDPNNCGECGNICGQDQYCDSGSCEDFNECGGTENLDGVPGEECQDCGEWVCDGDDAVYCDGGTDIQTDPDNCGECGNVCIDGEYCESGSCEVDQVVEVAVEEISAGEYSIGSHTCAVADGEVFCWGFNSWGQLGNATTSDSSTPVEVADLSSSIEDISGGERHSCAVDDAGNAYCWGRGWDGQLRNGDDSDQSAPVAVAGLSGPAAEITAGNNHTCALLEDEIVNCWGEGDHGQTGIGDDGDYSTAQEVEGFGDVQQLSTSDDHNCTVLDNGQVSCWGANSDGQLGDNQAHGGESYDRWLPVLVLTIPPVTSEAGWCFNGEDDSGNGLVGCEDPDCATDLGDETGLGLAEGQLLGFAGNYVEGTCGGTGPEMIYGWEAPEDGTFVIHGQGVGDAGEEVLFYVLQDSCTGFETACDQDGGDDDQPEIELDADEGDQFYIVVDSTDDGWDHSDYAYSLNIEKAD